MAVKKNAFDFAHTCPVAAEYAYVDGGLTWVDN